jgi:hypothetical protein
MMLRVAGSAETISSESNCTLMRIERLAFLECSSLISIVIPRDVKILGDQCFWGCESLSSISFESNCTLMRIESEAFYMCYSLRSINIPKSVTFIDGSAFSNLSHISISIESGNPTYCVQDDFIFDIACKTLILYFGLSSFVTIPPLVEILASGCFSFHTSLCSLSFLSDSTLARIESRAFSGTSVFSAHLPGTVTFIAGDAFSPECDLTIPVAYHCPEFAECNVRRQTDSALSFERRRAGLPSHPMLISDWVVDLRRFELVRAITRNPNFPVEIHWNNETGVEIVVKSFPELNARKEQLFCREIEALARLDHLCVVPFFGYVLRVRSVGPKIVTHFMPNGSLAETLESGPAWWDGTAKSIVACGVVRGMMKIHQSSIIHRDLKPSNILLDGDRRPRICDFGSSRDQSLAHPLTTQVGTPLYMTPELFEEEPYNEKVNVYSFALVLYEIVVGRPVFARSLTLPQLFRKLTKDE